jgi:hypothetical protein
MRTKTKLKIKPLAKPIKTIVLMRVKFWIDKTYGNTYLSARICVNNDWENEIILPFQLGSTSSNNRWEFMRLVQDKYKLSLPSDIYSMRDLERAGVYVDYSTEYVTKAECRRFGESK